MAALAARGESLLSLLDTERRPPECSVAFTIAVISLGAKMAKADGQVVVSEIRAFRQVFQIAENDETAVAKVFNYARQDVAGFEAYAKRIERMFRDRPQVLEDLIEGLLHIAMADGEYHENEAIFLEHVAQIFKITPETFAMLSARHLPVDQSDPWLVLGVSRDMSRAEIQKKWRALVRENHPDRLVARGLPDEVVTLANTRLAAFNAAWESISARPETHQAAGS